MINEVGENFWNMGLGWIVSIIILILVVWLVVTIVKKGNKPHQKSAMDILNERYASGVIDKREYEEKKNSIFK